MDMEIPGRENTEWNRLHTRRHITRCNRHTGDSETKTKHRPQNGPSNTEHTKKETLPSAKNKHHNLDPNDKEEFQSNLKKNLVQTPINTDLGVQEVYDELEQIIPKANEETTRNKVKMKHKIKLEPKTLALLVQREELQNTDTVEKRNEYSALDRETKRALRQDIRKHQTKVTEEILERT